MFKVKDRLSPTFMNEVHSIIMTQEKKTEFKRNNIKMVYNSETLSILGPRIWETVLGYI